MPLTSGLENIKQRVAMISPIRAFQAGGAVERIIKHDAPALIRVAEIAAALGSHMSGRNQADDPVCFDRLRDLDAALLSLSTKHQP
jgi:hypothetical protein